MTIPSILYVAFVALAILVALIERRVAFVNEHRLVESGAEEIAPWVFRLMVPVYSLIFPAAIAEHLLERRSPPAVLAGAMLLLFLLSKGLKLWGVRHLGEAWTMKVILPARLDVVTSGPYRYMRHPNYVAVMGEILALPLAGGAYATALAGAGLFFVILVFRVRTEEAALLARPEYAGPMGRRRRFLPGR
jgi:methyltransferase